MNRKSVIFGMQISIWEKESFYANRDVIIVGAGLVGLWTAYELKRKYPSKSVLIVERGVLPTGASTRNAGFACFGSPTELLYDKKILGEDKMLQVAEMRYRGINKIRQIFTDSLIGYDHCGGYECLRNDLNDINNLKDELPALNKALKSFTGKDEIFTWSNDSISAFGFAGFDAMIENKLESALHSGKLVQQLTRLIQGMGVDIINGIKVSGWHRQNNSISIEAVNFINESTTQSISLCAQQLIICTNAFTSQIAPELIVTPGRGQIMVTTEIPDLKMKGTFHFDEGFYYFRNLGKRILLGGGRNKAFEQEATTELNESDIIQQELKRFLKEHIAAGYQYEIEYRWSGAMGFTEDKQPVIKQLADNIHAVIACNGMGVALSPIIAEQVVDVVV